MNGVHKLARVLDRHVQRRNREGSRSQIDLGSIVGTSLVLDGFGAPIPSGDYLVSESFGLRTSSEAGGVGNSQYAAHDHEVRTPLTDGDRVVVLLIGGDDDFVPVVIERVV